MVFQTRQLTDKTMREMVSVWERERLVVRKRERVREKNTCAHNFLFTFLFSLVFFLRIKQFCLTEISVFHDWLNSLSLFLSITSFLFLFNFSSSLFLFIYFLHISHHTLCFYSLVFYHSPFPSHPLSLLFFSISILFSFFIFSNFLSISHRVKKIHEYFSYMFTMLAHSNI